MTLYTESIAEQTDHFTDAFVLESVVYNYDVMMFKGLQLMPFCLEKSSVRKGIF